MLKHVHTHLFKFLYRTSILEKRIIVYIILVSDGLGFAEFVA